MRHTKPVFAVVSMAFAAMTCPAQGPSSQGIDPATVAAYEKLGATYGGWVKGPVDFHFDVHHFAKGSKQATKGVPGFDIMFTKQGMKFPLVATPFALRLSETRVIDVGKARARVNDSTLKDVASLKTLTALYLEGALLSAGGLKELAALPNLTTLDLYDSIFFEDPLKELALLPGLKILGLRSRGRISTPDTVGDASMKHVALLKNLTALSLDSGEITDVGAKKLAALKRLVRLDLSRTKITDNAARQLRDMSDLSWLSLDRTMIGDAGMKDLASLKKLSTLSLGNTDITDAGLQQIAPLKNITVLDLSGTKVTGIGFKELTSQENLIWLELKSTKLTDAGLKHVGRFKKLQRLSLDWTEVTDAGLKDLAALKELKDLNLNWCEKVSDVGLKELEGLLNLGELRLVRTKVTRHGVAELQKALPKCKIYSDVSPHPGPMPVYITPFYDSDELQINVGEHSKKLAAADAKSILDTANEIGQEREKLRPETMYVMAIRLYDLGHKDEATYWFYTAQFRARLFVQALDRKKVGQLGAPAFELASAYGAFFQLTGEYINGYAFGDLDKLKKTLARVMDENKKAPELDKLYPGISFVPAASWEKSNTEVRDGLRSLIDLIEKDADKIREQRKKNGMDARY